MSHPAPGRRTPPADPAGPGADRSAGAGTCRSTRRRCCGDAPGHLQTATPPGSLSFPAPSTNRPSWASHTPGGSARRRSRRLRAAAGTPARLVPTQDAAVALGRIPLRLQAPGTGGRARWPAEPPPGALQAHAGPAGQRLRGLRERQAADAHHKIENVAALPAPEAVPQTPLAINVK